MEAVREFVDNVRREGEVWYEVKEDVIEGECV